MPAKIFKRISSHFLPHCFFYFIKKILTNIINVKVCLSDISTRLVFRREKAPGTGSPLSVQNEGRNIIV